MRIIFFAIALLTLEFLSAQSKQLYLLAGTYTDGKSEGIYTYKFDTENGNAQLLSKIKATNPSYLAISKDENNVYAISDARNGQNSEVAAYQFNKQTGELSLINKLAEKGSGACYITVDNNKKWVFLANYASGNLTALSVRKDGGLDTIKQFFQDTGKSVHKTRQQEPHIHTAVFSPNENYLYVTDLGNDQIHQFPFKSSANLPLSINQEKIIKCKPGNGPRHLEFSKDSRIMYVINELSGTIDVFDCKRNNSALIQTISTDSTQSDTKGSADIHISPEGTFLYATNRGSYNTISTFSILSNGQLSLLQVQSTGGIMPRNFVIDPTGNYILIGHQKSNNITIFRRNKYTGILTKINQQINVGSPVCLKFISL